MSGETGLTRKKIEEVLASFQSSGAVSVDINAGFFAKTCEFAPSLAVVCDVLKERGEVVEHALGESGYGSNMVVRIKL